MKKGICFILCIATWLLAACSPVLDPILPEAPTEASTVPEEAENVVLISTDTLIVTREGNKTTISDLTSGQTHTLIMKKILRRKTDTSPRASIINDTDTLQIQQLRGVLLVTEKGTNENHLI